jgi:hypothetical protein
MVDWKKALEIIKKAIVVFPVLVEVIGEIEGQVQAAKDPTSAGGQKMTPVEVASIVAVSITKITGAIIDLFSVSAEKK